ncbi:MAG TPA: EamA family transporter RarD [Nocardioidaceae bacterium]|nr:EamA family transporter RarD [Nocardioidaceae bacterium]
MTEERRGLLLGTAAFGMWGLFPLYWPLLEPTMAVEILAHRILWSLVVTAIMLAVTGRTGLLRAMWTRREVRYPMMVAGVVIGLNWGTFIWGVTNGHVVDTSLGYYINPLVTVLLGVLVLKERLRRWQWLALALAFAAVVVLSLEVGHPPWISLVLAFSFGIYGLIKKRVAVGPIEGLTFEGLVLVPVAAGYLLWIEQAGQSTALSQGPGHVAMLAFTGVLTALPLLCFAGAANRIPLTTLGLLQYIAPTVQLILGVALFDEQMGVYRWVGFSLVWVALTIFTVDSLAAHRRRRGVATTDRDDAAELEPSLPR